MFLIRYLVVLCAVAAGCTRQATEAPGDAELPEFAVTRWSQQTELFMEYPTLVAGERALFAVHLTRLSDFSAMTTGRPRIDMTPVNGGSRVILQGDVATRPGVYRIEQPMPAAGRYRWALAIDAPGLADTHDLGEVTVFADDAAAHAGSPGQAAAEDASAISYLKEPQWANGFATALVEEGEVRRSVRLPAVIEPLTGGEAIVSAPIDGRYITARTLSVGDRVQPNQEVGRIQPRLGESGPDRAGLASDVTEAQAALEGAQSELARAQRLLAERAVPRRRVEEAQRAVTVAGARLEAARARLEQRDQTLTTGGGAAGGNAFVLRAPIAGRVADVFAAVGASYDEGAPLFRIVRTDRVELQVQVPAADAPLPAGITSIELEIAGRAERLVVDAGHMHDAGVLDPRTHALPVQFDVDNRAGQLLIGQTATAILYSGGRERMPVVPAAAILAEAGRPYVFVQLGGESFARRFVEIAARDGGKVGLRAGVKPGDRVVTRGAYDVQLASAASGLPAEGHVH
jgi:membrane fusion protein, heavy metal efflux system